MAVVMNSASSDMLLLMDLSRGMLRVVIVEFVVATEWRSLVDVRRVRPLNMTLETDSGSSPIRAC